MYSLLDYLGHYGGQMVMDKLERRREEKNNQTTVDQLINAAQNELGEEQIRQGLTPFTGQGQGGKMLGWTQPEAGPEALATQRGTPATPQGQMFGLKDYLTILQNQKATATQRLQDVKALHGLSEMVQPKTKTENALVWMSKGNTKRQVREANVQSMIDKGYSPDMPISGEETTPPDIKEYNYAQKQGYTGSFVDFQKEMKRAGAITINMERATKTDLEKNIVETQTQIDAFNEIEKMFQDDYITYKGQIKAGAEKIGEKAGIFKPSGWLTKRQLWYQTAKEKFLAYRKWVTGVAGGEKELMEIAKSYPDPDNNSPTEYRANLKQARINAIRLQKRYQMFLSQGIVPTKEQLSSIPLNQIGLTKKEMGAIDVGERFTIIKVTDKK